MSSEPCRAPVLVTDRGQVDDHGDVLVAESGVSPDVLVDADRGDPVEPGRVVDEAPLAFGEDRGVRGVPRHPETGGGARDGEVVDHDRSECPPDPAAGDLRPGRGPPSTCPAARCGGRTRTGSGAPGLAASSAGARTVHAPAGASPCPVARPRRRTSDTTGHARRRGHSITARSGSRRCPTASRPSSSRRQNVVRSGAAKG